MARNPDRPRRPRKIPRFTFLLGAGLALVPGLPLLALSLLVAARAAHLGDPGASVGHFFWLTFVFAGAPAFVAGGGVARLAAHRGAEIRQATGRSPLKNTVFLSAGAMAVSAAGLAFLVAVPLGGMPESPWGWLPLVPIGAVTGAVTGAALGIVVWRRLKQLEEKTAHEPQAG